MVAAVADVAAQTVTLSVSPSTISEDDSSADVTVTATLSPTRSSDTVVTLSKAGTAGDPDDYHVPGSLPSITIPPNQTRGTATLVVSLVDDTRYEGDETIRVEGSSTGVSVAAATITVQDDDARPTITLSADNIGLNEGGPRTTGSAPIRARLLGTSSFSEDTTVTFDFAESEATKGSDFTVTPDPLTLTILAGATSATRTASFSVLDDNLYEGTSDHISVSGTGTDHLGSDLQFAYPQSSRLILATIFDDEESAPRLGFPSVESVILYEDGAPAIQTVEVSLSTPSANAVDVMVRFSSSDRYTVTPETASIRIPPGDESGSVDVTITPRDNHVVEPSGFVVVSATAAGSGYGGRPHWLLPYSGSSNTGCDHEFELFRSRDNPAARRRDHRMGLPQHVRIHRERYPDVDARHRQLAAHRTMSLQ